MEFKSVLCISYWNYTHLTSEQLIISGDFLQLPPVPDQDSRTVIASTFAFDSHAWKRCVGDPISLCTVFRQKDPGIVERLSVLRLSNPVSVAFVRILNAARLGKLDPETNRTLNGLCRPVHYSDGIEPNHL